MKRQGILTISGRNRASAIEREETISNRTWPEPTVRHAHRILRYSTVIRPAAAGWRDNNS
jgi:hypothetical protein